MRILMLTERMDRGGAETHILTLARELVRRGHALSVASEGGSLVSELEAIGVRHIRLPLASLLPHAMIYCRARLRRLLRSGKFDVVHSHSRLASLLCEDIAKKYAVGFFVTAHARFSTSFLRRRFSRWGDAPIAVSEDLRQYLCECYGVLPCRVRVIPNGVDDAHFCPTKQIKQTEQIKNEEIGRKILFLSRLDADCSQGAYLLCGIAPRLYRKYPDFRICIGGGGTQLVPLRALAEAVNERVGARLIECVGDVRDSADFFSGGDIFVGVSRAAIEAGMCGLSILLCGNEGYFGRLCAQNAEEALLSNFSARGKGAPDAERLFEDICEIFEEGREDILTERDALRQFLVKNCSASRTARLVEEHYMKNMSAPRSKKEVLLCGYYGYSNIGDDALLLTAAERARRELGGARLLALTKNGKRDSRRFGIECVRRYSPVALLCALRDSEVFILGGGTLLQNDTSRRSLVYYCALILLAKVFGCECLAWGSGIGRVRGRLSRALCRYALSLCSTVETRDMRSYAIARSIVGARASLSGDLCQSPLFVPSDKGRAEFLLGRIFKGERPPFFVVAMKGDAEAALRIRVASELKRERERGREILFVVMCEREDQRMSEEMARAVGGVVLGDVCLADLCAILGYAEGVCSMRLHALIAGSIAGCPIYPIGTDEKILRYCREIR